MRLTKEESEKLHKEFSNSTHRIFSHFVKSLVLQEPVTLLFRNRSIDEALPVMIELKNKMASIDRLFGMISAQLGAMPGHVDKARWETALDNAWERHRLIMEEIRLQLIKIYESWLQSFTGSEA